MAAPKVIVFSEYLETVPEIFKDGAKKEFVCDSCGKHRPVLVRVGEEPDYESANCALCKKCLKEALALVEGKE